MPANRYSPPTVLLSPSMSATRSAFASPCATEAPPSVSRVAIIVPMNFCAVSLSVDRTVCDTSSRVMTNEFVSFSVVRRAYCWRSDTVSLVLPPSVSPVSARRPEASSCCAVTRRFCSFRIVSLLPSLRDLVEVNAVSIKLSNRLQQRAEHSIDRGDQP